jgi:hypothetical protein
MKRFGHAKKRFVTRDDPPVRVHAERALERHERAQEFRNAAAVRGSVNMKNPRTLKLCCKFAQARNFFRQKLLIYVEAEVSYVDRLKHT